MGNNNWPKISYNELQPTLYLIHMAVQMIGKLKLTQDFELHWAGSPLWLTSSGLTSGMLHFGNDNFAIDINFHEHQIQIYNSLGQRELLSLKSMSVAELYSQLFQILKKMKIDLKVNTMPVEIINPIRFERDTEKYLYQPNLAKSWWQALCQIHRVLQSYHVLFRGISPPIGLMWGTLDLRDVRYKGIQTPITTANSDFIRKNAMDDEQIEVGWWWGNPNYPKPAFFSFTYPQPLQIEHAKIAPAAARWESSLSEFILDYEDLLKSNRPDDDLFAFFQSTYQAGAERADWDPKLIGSGKPVL